MAIGERIRFLRNLHGATQKWLGIKLGFSEKTAETRVGQYEIGVRTPKDDMIKDIAKIFGVSPQVIKLPDIDNYDALLHTLFAIEDIYGLTINMLDDEFCLPSIEIIRLIFLCMICFVRGIKLPASIGTAR